MEPEDRQRSGDIIGSSGIIYPESHIHDVGAPLVQQSEVFQTTPRPEPIVGWPSFLGLDARYTLSGDLLVACPPNSKDPTPRPSGYFSPKFGEILSGKVAEMPGLKHGMQGKDAPEFSEMDISNPSSNLAAGIQGELATSTSTSAYVDSGHGGPLVALGYDALVAQGDSLLVSPPPPLENPKSGGGKRDRTPSISTATSTTQSVGGQYRKIDTGDTPLQLPTMPNVAVNPIPTSIDLLC